MKLKEKIKRFLTLDVHGHEGFTLVELIIVIAILAILSSVAVVGYSSYIKKANMQADQTMVAEIKNALTLAYYSEDLTESGYLILSVDGIVNADEIAEDSSVYKVMAAAYGSNWTETLKLKYSEWTVSPAYTLLTGQAVEHVANCSFVTGGNPSALMENVTTMTNAMASALGVKTDSVASLERHLDADSIAAVKTQMGVTDLNELDETELSNFALLAVAHEYSNKDADESGSTLVNLVDSYALYSAYIYSDYSTEADKAAYEEMNKALANTATADLTDYNDSVTEYANEQLSVFLDQIFTNSEENIGNWSDANGETDISAIGDMMAALNKGSANLTLEDLSDSALATEGVLGAYFKQYINAALALAANGEVPEIKAGQVAVCFSIVDGIVIYTTID